MEPPAKQQRTTFHCSEVFRRGPGENTCGCCEAWRESGEVCRFGSGEVCRRSSAESTCSGAVSSTVRGESTCSGETKRRRGEGNGQGTGNFLNHKK